LFHCKCCGGASRNVRRPDFVPGVNPYLTNDRLILNPAAFAAPQPGTFGNLGRNTGRGPHFTNVDIAFLKDTKVNERLNLQFRAEMFNVLNHTNFHLPNSDISSPTFNQILAAEPPRLVQFALKFLF